MVSNIVENGPFYKTIVQFSIIQGPRGQDNVISLSHQMLNLIFLFLFSIKTLIGGINEGHTQKELEKVN